MNITLKIRRKLTKLRLTPIRVYCLHHVCAQFDPDSMNQGDWMDINLFKDKITSLRNRGVSFISLPEAHRKISHDLFRTHEYAVLTFDDGYASLKEILPWLAEQSIPATLFLSCKYLDGISYRNKPSERYLTHNDLNLNPLFTIGHHGWEHNDATKLTPEELRQSIVNNLSLLSSHPNYTPFWAYTWGNHNTQTDNILKHHSITPVLIDGMPNYNDPTCIHRCLLN